MYVLRGRRWTRHNGTEDDDVWEVRPFEGVGPLRFGMTRDEVIEILGEPDGILGDDPLLVEHHNWIRVEAGYDAAGRLTAVQLVEERPCSILGLNPAGRELAEVRLELEGLSITCKPDERGMTLPDLGVHLHARRVRPHPVLSVLIGSRDYEAAFGDS